jgi:hypothetical protein
MKTVVKIHLKRTELRLVNFTTENIINATGSHATAHNIQRIQISELWQ